MDVVPKTHNDKIMKYIKFLTQSMACELFDFVQSLQLISTNSTYGQAVLEACASLNPDDPF